MKLFETPGAHNTDECIKLAIDFARRGSIRYIVIASTKGYSATKAMEYLVSQPPELVVITHNTGFSKLGEQEFEIETKEKLLKFGARVYTGTHILRNIGRAIRNKTGYSESEIVSHTLRMFGEGTKVCFEIAAMACDAGIIPPEEVVCLAGTSRGADTAALILARPSNNFFDMKLIEYIAKPR